ncbi:3-deoxy-manno-octulosonate cytidylyltransferase [methane-oxidizing endosymbiont of Gigantopelta aegis]|uniref:3-deoxy-manno-octulosonate cytidylyltransferase n=1 Tax=methane-oxidizing endosymbiont of Gigantopelta aegis TaxID=2794938 RepID=UPI0018DD8B1C|nr:3-deoxy-manno-octulosonate cytidylyltransferase [methane-oxidizing endosymbiont of Gigantopelta aegis]
MAGFKVVIPARYGSTRLPGKPLLDIAGKPMIQHVCEKALKAHAEQVVVATDDTRIFKAVKALGLEVVMTRTTHQSGTERIAEVAEIMQWPEDVVIVNLQGDEPLIPAAYINDVARVLMTQSKADMSTLAARVSGRHEVFNANAVKVVLDRDDYALYFSRAPIPWHREHFPEAMPDNALPYYRHIGMYAYRVAFLKRYCQWPASPLEEIESLEQLRVLWHGDAIKVKVVDKIPEAGVDTEEDLHRINQILS